MGESTSIGWCDATFNPWWGCERVSPGCAHCYADGEARRRGHRIWGPGHAFRFLSEDNWKKPLRWARLARQGRLPDGSENVDGHRPRIFTASMADVFEERLEVGALRERLFALIAATPELDWLVLTKRPEYARAVLSHPMFWLYVNAELLRQAFPVLPGGMNDYAAGRLHMANLWMGVSIENARFTYRADVLREIPAAVRFISAEPLLGSLFEESRPERPRAAGNEAEGTASVSGRRAPLNLSGIDWVIVGGESGPRARPFHLEHAREIIRAARRHSDHLIPCSPECAEPEPALFVKQLGAKPMGRTMALTAHDAETVTGRWSSAPLKLRHRKGEDWDEWPADLRIRQFPQGALVA